MNKDKLEDIFGVEVPYQDMTGRTSDYSKGFDDGVDWVFDLMRNFLKEPDNDHLR